MIPIGRIGWMHRDVLGIWVMGVPVEVACGDTDSRSVAVVGSVLVGGLHPAAGWMEQTE